MTDLSIRKVDPIYHELAAQFKDWPNSKYLPLILEKLVTLEQAKIIAELPAPSEDIAKKLDLDKEAVDKHLQQLVWKGIVLPTKKGYVMCRSVMQLHDTVGSIAWCDKSVDDEYFTLWDEIVQEANDLWATLYTGSGSGIPFMRIIPRWKSIKDIPGVEYYEDIRALFKENEDALAIIHCPCKGLWPNRECGIPDETCLIVSSTARYNLKRGTARKLTVEEALEIVDNFDRYQVVHVTINQKLVNQLICNCHYCCCGVFVPLLRAGGPDKVREGVAKSRFEAVVDPEKCKACRACVNACQFGAAEMKFYPDVKTTRSMAGAWRAFTDTDKCMGCGCCVLACPQQARSMKLVRPPEHIPDVWGGSKEGFW